MKSKIKDKGVNVKCVSCGYIKPKASENYNGQPLCAGCIARMNGEASNRYQLEQIAR